MPKLRFSKFSQEWSKLRLGDYVQNFQKKVSSDTDIPVYSSSRQGLKPQAEYFADRELQNDGEYGVVPYGYITYRHMSDDNTFHFNLNDKLPEIAVSKEYPVFKGKGLNNYFLISKLNHTNEFKEFAIQQKSGGTRTRLYFKKLCDWYATFPTLEEQIKIADFLSSVDESITILNNQLDLMCKYKKGMMQKVFSQELRFKDDDERHFPKWTFKKLGEVATFLKGKGVAKSDISDLGEHECIRYGELYTHYNEVIKKIKSRTNQVLMGSILSSARDVLIPSSGESVLDISKASCVLMSNVILGGDLNIIRSKLIDGVFLSYYINSQKKYEIAKMAQGNSVVHLYAKQLSKMDVSYPCLKEQTKIANFLSAIDDKITTKKAELDKLETWKQGLLQQMFV
ncbi:restriction endonuclease subunit S [Serratia marcescens]|uniref:restriction endonuclease subunit S n=1 Tax=Serratia sarumanii TaxID=3020826 RepID=UPI001A2723F5|nr:restriction endonuclease subunit S [Serratia marcescens]HEJ6937041.1 restriction endonuclease subunit S [Serratia marcescens]HEJ7844616.1 restriction endonuclease subunit S [Serratia marcescens]